VKSNDDIDSSWQVDNLSALLSIHQYPQEFLRIVAAEDGSLDTCNHSELLSVFFFV
jgi:hypothetical protein